ncbi:MAG: pentapeptide repeat-containing protein [Acidobacteria bacterium]|nr:pentapeptide repeat-containing protein [Acidobacteriota bacterium]
MFPDQLLTGCFRCCDFSGQDLRGALFQDADLYRASFSHSYLEGATFINCFAAEANFEQAHCAEMRARHSNFYLASFRLANLSEALLWDCVLASADLRGAILRRLTLTLDCNSFEETRLDRAASAQLAYLFGRARSPHRQGWLDIIGDGDLVRLDRVFTQ